MATFNPYLSTLFEFSTHCCWTFILSLKQIKFEESKADFISNSAHIRRKMKDDKISLQQQNVPTHSVTA